MTMPAGLLDKSAIQRLLASMQGGTQHTVQAPNLGGLMAPQIQPTPAFNPNQPVADERGRHDHRSGVRGSILHAVGADTVAPELASLLTPDQQARVQPGLMATIGNAVIRGKTPAQVQQERALNMLGLEDTKKARDKRDREEAMWGQIQEVAAQIPDPQTRLEYTARMASSMGLAQGADAAMAAQRLEPGTSQPMAIRTIPNVKRDGKVFTDIVSGDGRLIRSEEQFIRPNDPPPQNLVATQNPDGTITYKAVPTRVAPGQPVQSTDTGLELPNPKNPQEIRVINTERSLAYRDAERSIASMMNADGTMKDPPNYLDRVATKSDWTNWAASGEGQVYMSNTRKLIRAWVVLIEGKRMSDADARVNEMMRSFRPGDDELADEDKKATLKDMAASIQALGQSGVSLPMPGAEPSATPPAGGRTVTVNGKTFIIP